MACNPQQAGRQSAGAGGAEADAHRLGVIFGRDFTRLTISLTTAEGEPVARHRRGSALSGGLSAHELVRAHKRVTEKERGFLPGWIRAVGQGPSEKLYVLKGAADGAVWWVRVPRRW